LLQTDVSAVGLGTVLEQGGHVIAYYPEQCRTTIQHNTEGMSGSSLYSKAVLPLLTESLLSIVDRSCSSAVAFSSKDGRFVMPLGLSYAGV